MASPNDSITHLSVTADDLDEAVEFVVAELQKIVVERGARGFTAPSCTQESFELIDDVWTRVFEFSADLLGGA